MSNQQNSLAYETTGGTLFFDPSYCIQFISRGGTQFSGNFERGEEEIFRILFIFNKIYLK